MTQHGIERSFQGLNMNDSPGTQKKIPPAVAPKPSKVLNTSPKPFKAGITYRSEINLWVKCHRNSIKQVLYTVPLEDIDYSI